MDQNPNRKADGFADGVLLFKRGRFSDAIRSLSEFEDRDGAQGLIARYYIARSRFELGRECMSKRRFADAGEHVRKAREAIGGYADLCTYLANTFAGAGEFHHAAEEMDKAATREPGKADHRRRLAQARWHAGRRVEAYMDLTRAIREFPDDSSLRLQLGLFYAAEERYDLAGSAMAQAVEADPSRAEAHYYFGLVSIAQGHNTLAVRELQRAYELRPGDLMLAYQLSLACRSAVEQGLDVEIRLPEIPDLPEKDRVRQLAAMVTREPDVVDAFLALEETGCEQELFGLLGNVLQVALKEHPGYADLHFRCARVWHRLERRDRWRHHLDEALRINPNYVDALLFLARNDAEADRPAEAIAHLRQAIQSGADWPDVHLFAGQLMQQCDFPEGARKHLQRALELNENYTEAAEALSSLAA